jgi:hypothetical protein
MLLPPSYNFHHFYRLYVPTPEIDTDPGSGKGGIAGYSKPLGLFLKCFGYAERLRVGGKVYYVNKKSYATWKDRHPGYQIPATAIPILLHPKSPLLQKIPNELAKVITSFLENTGRLPLTKGVIIMGKEQAGITDLTAQPNDLSSILEDAIRAAVYSRKFTYDRPLPCKLMGWTQEDKLFELRFDLNARGGFALKGHSDDVAKESEKEHLGLAFEGIELSKKEQHAWIEKLTSYE